MTDAEALTLLIDATKQHVASLRIAGRLDGLADQYDAASKQLLDAQATTQQLERDMTEAEALIAGLSCLCISLPEEDVEAQELRREAEAFLARRSVYG